jgi:hypothetical protein
MEGSGAASAVSGSTAMVASQGSALGSVRTSVPPGIRIKWFQRKETISIDIEAPDCEDPQVTMEDEGVVTLRAKDPRQNVTLQLLHRIHSSKSRQAAACRRAASRPRNVAHHGTH